MFDLHLQNANPCPYPNGMFLALATRINETFGRTRMRPAHFGLCIIFGVTTYLLAGTNAFAVEEAIQLVGREGEKVTLSAADLKDMERVEFDVTERDGAKLRYSGVELSRLLEKVGAAQGDKLRGEWLRSFVVVEATDGYRAVLSLAETDSTFSDRRVYLADTRNGEPLDQKHGPFQLIIPDEKRFSRWVRMVNSIRIIDCNLLISIEK